MGGCRCSYRNCKSATKLNADLHFFHYPVKHRDRCSQWIKNARRPEFCNLPDDQLRNKVVCDLHFEQRYFTNVLRKRLVHNAVPTIQVGCDDVVNENPSEFKDVQILPANDDGTIFTLDTDSMQQKSDTEPISTYSFRNGALVPVYSEEQSDTEPVLYTIDEEDLKPISYREQSANANNYLFIDPNRPAQASESYEIVFNGDSESSHISYERKPRSQSPVFVEYQRKNFMVNQSRSSSQDAMEVVYITEHEEHANSPVTVKPDPDAVTTEPVKQQNTKVVRNECKVRENHSRPSQIFKKRVLNQLKQNCREIALIKRILKANSVRSKKFNINNLRGRISPTLLGALSLNLHNKKSNFTSDEYEFLTTLYKLSPDMYNMFYEKLGWNLPNPSIVEELLQKSH